MHRTGNGNVISRCPEDLEKWRQRWFADNRTVFTYCSEAEWHDYIEDLGELVSGGESKELRIHATIKDRTKSGAYRIIHNCILVGKDDDWRYFKMAARARVEAAFINPANRPQ